MPDEPEIDTSKKPSLFSAIVAMRHRRHRVAKAKRAAEDIHYLNIVAMMDMMTIILVFLLKSVSFSTMSVAHTQTLNLPYSTTQMEPIEAVKVFITKDKIIVEDKKVASIEYGAVVPGDLDKKNNYLIPNLQKALDKKAAQLATMQAHNPHLKIQNNLTILADKDTPYMIVMQVMYTSSRASGGPQEQELSFGTFRLTVLKRGG